MDILDNRSCQLSHLTESLKTSLELNFPSTIAAIDLPHSEFWVVLRDCTG